jgi:hypothetical protein
MIEKITLNGIPVYRKIEEDQTWFYLFEYDINGNVIVINNTIDTGRQLDIVYLDIQERLEKKLRNINTSFLNN